MTTDELIKQCRYYKGEKRCPFESEQGDNRPSIWFYEKSWVEDMLAIGTPAFDVEVAEYDAYKAGESISTTLPKTLLARLFNRYAKGSYSMADAAMTFKSFYGLWYGEPAGA